ncbi:MAG: hypothetical protein AAF288_07675 [Planctomycetota bacterium]
MNLPFLDELKAAVQRDRKKFALAGTCACFGLLLWGRLIFLDRVPKTAVANPDGEAVEVESAATTQARPEPVFLGVLPDRPNRDVFAIDPTRYRPDPAADKSENAGKTGRSGVDENARLEQARRDARDLTLESVIQGHRPRAVLNNELLRPGQTIEGFTLLSIGDNHVVVARNGLAFRLHMPAATTNPNNGSLE